jgi:MoxR-like ATPase
MDVKRLLKTIWFTPGPKHRWGLPVLFEGKPGSGKTSLVEQGAAQCALHCRVVIGSLHEPSDFLGMPFPNKDKEGRLITSYSPPSWAAEVRNAVRAVVPFDEVNTAAPATQAALLRVILEGVVGDDVLPNTVRFCAMMNSTEDAAGGWDLAAPLANRFLHFKWDGPDASEWCDWALGGANGQDAVEGGFSAEAEEKRVLEAWPSPWAKARGVVAGFIQKRPELLHQMPKSGDPKASKAWPSQRTWEYVMRGLAGAEVHGLPEIDRDELLAGAVGTGAAGELITYITEADLPDPADLLDGKVTFVHEPKRLDRTVAVLASCAALVTGNKATKQAERSAALWKICQPIVKDAADVIVPAARSLVKAKLSKAPEARPVLLKLQPILSAAGITA